jgi:aspartyl/glutamyl-tRNA(Asn/Gln) amidotransferase C subunit
MHMPKLTENDVKKIAKLVKLDVTGQEQQFAQMFTATLDYIKVLDELDTTNVSETYQVTGLTNVYQKKEIPSKTLTQEDSLKNASAKHNGAFETKGVFDR